MIAVISMRFALGWQSRMSARFGVLALPIRPATPLTLNLSLSGCAFAGGSKTDLAAETNQDGMNR